MAKKDKINKEELVDEEIVYEEEIIKGSSSSQAPLTFFEKYKNIIFGVAAVVAVGFIGYMWFNSNREEKTVEANDAMVRAVMYFEADSTRLALEGDGQNSGFLDIIDDFGGTAPGNLANYYAGICYLKRGQIEQAIEYLEDFSKGDDMVAASAYASLGYAYEELQEFEKAASFYEKASRLPEENGSTTPFYLMDAARNYESAGDNGKALEIYQKIKKKFPLSDEGQKVDKYIARLES
ncbi:MAG: tetratricopeptide repeat protein [Bacteroidia bacterium]|nr:tetratricopeptide repeat protein [Bacteroidia bacterium]